MNTDGKHLNFCTSHNTFILAAPSGLNSLLKFMVLKNFSVFILASILFAFTECSQSQQKKEEDKNKDKDKETAQSANYTSPQGYNLNTPLKIDLRTELDEISGLSYYAKDTSVFAITDDNGSLYKIHLTNSFPIEKWKFSKGHDFEDLVLVDSTFYVVASKGIITTFKFVPAQGLVTDTFNLDLAGKNEFEILYHDNASNKLVMICKDCEADNKKAVTAYSFDPVNRTFSNNPFYTIDATEIADKLGMDKVKFKPSGACINPVTNELFIISSVNKALVVADTSGKVKSVYQLDPKIYKQPEGITFTPSGDLIISNEAADVGAANVLIFKYKSTVK